MLLKGKNLFILGWIFFSISCNSKFELIRLDSIEDRESSNAPLRDRRDRNSHELYIPDSTMSYKSRMRQLRVNVVFMDCEVGNQNLQGDDARKFALELIDQANYRLSRNVKMNLPIGNSTPVYPINFRLVPYPNEREFVRFEYDDDLYFVIKGKNQFDRRVINTYAKDLDSVLNIFIMPHHPDSLKSETYGTLGIGIALGNAVKIHQDFINDPQAWKSGGALVHEIGHVLGLRHSWRGNDRCNDTPHHANCWGPSESPPCDQGWSNNLMDYNQDKKAVTPCQLGIVNQSFNRDGSKIRKLLVKDWCEKELNNYIIIDKVTNWNADMDICSDVIISNGAVLHINASVRMAAGALFLIEDKAKVILGAKSKIYNDCNQSWGGFISKSNEMGQVIRYQGSLLEHYPEQN